MDINNDLINRLEELSKLKLSREEKEILVPQIAEVTTYFDTLNELDTNSAEPLSYAFELHNVLRSDEVKPSLSAGEITANAEAKDGCFTVPQTVEG